MVFLSVVSALHADEAGVVDWHHKLIGTPIDESTFLHKPIAGSGALAYTLTDRNVLAAVNLRDGAIGRRLISVADLSLATITSGPETHPTFRRMYDSWLLN